jgi:putative ABC transport system permease protein
LQREQIAALKALGYTNLSIAMHYLKLVIIIVLSGVLLGIALGYWLGNQLTGMYQQVFHFPQFYYRVRSELLITALGVTSLAGAASAWYAIRSSVRLSPAQAMRPPAPGVYKKSFAEPLVRYLGLASSSRMVIRNMGRHPWRFTLTVVGIAASMAVLISGLFWRDSIAKMIDVQFSHALRGDISVYLTDPRPASVMHEFMQLPQVSGVEVARTVNVRLSHDQYDWRGLIQGKPEHPQLHRIIDVDMKEHAPTSDGLLITDRLADRLHVHPGDKVKVEIQEGDRLTFDLNVIGEIREMMGMNAYIERRSLNHHLHEGDIVNQVTLSIEKEHETILLNKLKQFPLVALAISKNILLTNIESTTARNLLVISTVLTLFASVITIGVVYNQARISLTERAWEFASLRVLGFTRGEVSFLLLGELGIAIALAIPLGLCAGYWLALGIVHMIKTDEFYFSLVIHPSTYAYASLCVLFAATASALVVNRHIASLDLVGVLKTRD